MKVKTEQGSPAKPGKVWQKTHHSNLLRYVPSGSYFARIRVGGKLIRRSLETVVLRVAKLKLADLEKEETTLSDVAARHKGQYDGWEAAT